MSSEVERDVIWRCELRGTDLTADEVIMRIADSLGHAYPQVEVENILEELAKTGKTPARRNSQKLGDGKGGDLDTKGKKGFCLVVVDKNLRVAFRHAHPFQ